MAKFEESEHVERSNRLCEAIASLAENSTEEDVSKLLHPLISDYSQVECDPYNEKDGNVFVDATGNLQDDGVTPIMVACDTAQVSCLRYMDTHFLENDADIWGHPLDTTSEDSGGNAAIHFAAMSGCTEGIDYLCSMTMKWDTPSSTTNGSTKSNSYKTMNTDRENLCFRFLSQTNIHGDTPLMMASTAGHEKCLRQWTKRLIESFRAEDNATQSSNVETRVRNLFQLQNESGDSMLSLACGHGHVEVVDFLIRNHGLLPGKEIRAGVVDVTYEDVHKCKATLDRIETIVNQATWDTLTGSQREEFQGRHENVRRCLVMLQVASARAAEQNMESLIQAEDKNKNNQNICQQHQVGRKKKKRTKTGNKASGKPSKAQGTMTEETPVNKTGQNGEDSVWEHIPIKQNEDKATVGVMIGGKKLSIPGFTTLQDGTVINPRTPDLSGSFQQSDSSLRLSSSEHCKSVEEMLKERYREKEKNDSTIDAVMESLCLDASMLLLSPHGMAMNLSPSQLEAVAGILEKQINAAEEARRIQGRFRSRTP